MKETRKLIPPQERQFSPRPSFLRIPHPREFVLSCESHRPSKSTTDSLAESWEKKKWEKELAERRGEDAMRGRVTEASHTRILHLAHACMHVCVCCTRIAVRLKDRDGRGPFFRKITGFYDRQRLENKLAMSLNTCLCTFS